MKSFTRLLTLFISTILLPAALWANVIVKGHVNFLNGTPAANYPVYILSDSGTVANPSCSIYHTRYTNANGVYQDTLVCNANIAFVMVYVRDCNNIYITRSLPVTASGIVEANFNVCQNNQCLAAFTSQSNYLVTNFISGNSSAGNTTDSVIKRTWTFGDGTSLNGNVVNPVHSYATPGTYNVCLRIKTSDSCESSICHTVAVTAPVQCQAAFVTEVVPTNKIRFNSNTSIIAPTDSIVSRKWTFGDGDSLMGNTINPLHQYTPGIYTACLYITTRLGCQSYSCKTIVVGIPTGCHATFTVAPVPNSNSQNIHFNGWVSTTSAGDSLYQFLWNFGDGTTATTGDPNHLYAQPGTYYVCLRIKSYGGCIDSICRSIVVPPIHCRALFTFTSTPATSTGGLPVTVHFQSNGSFAPQGDSIISRKWNFGDGVILTGNNIDPNHAYTIAGTYQACLYIHTAAGCNDTLCATIVIPPATTNTQCEPRFVFTSAGLVVHFNSITSSAAAGDSIIGRLWTFGDGTSATTIDPVHSYAQAGRYLVCLRITSRLGCVKTKCDSITVVNPAGNCVAHFTAQMPSPHIAVLNSTSSVASQATDSIVSRKWTFGDGQSLLTGNTVSPTHQYTFGGTYNVCLSIRTRLGCESRWCTNIHVTGDSTYNDPIRIVSIYPNPVTSPLNIVIWGRNANVPATLAIYDIYGIVKYSITTTLPVGNSAHQLPTATLAPGPYIFKLTTMFGTQNRNFFKL